MPIVSYARADRVDRVGLEIGVGDVHEPAAGLASRRVRSPWRAALPPPRARVARAEFAGVVAVTGP